MGKRAAFVGLTNIDYIYYIDEFPEENSKCKTNNYEKYIGGPAANAAITYAALGGDATLITAIGSSDEADGIAKKLEEYGVKLINVAKDNKLPGMSTICISGDGKRTIISGQREFAYIDVESVDMVAFDFALFDLNQQNIALPILQKIGCEIVLDAGSYKENTEKFLARADIVISSEQFRDSHGRDVFEMPYPNIKLKAMSRGEKSILTLNGEIEVDKVTCVDSLAAGDIMHGAFCYGYYDKGMGFEDALKYASGIASESVKYKGPREWINSYKVR